MKADSILTPLAGVKGDTFAGGGEDKVCFCRLGNVRLMISVTVTCLVRILGKFRLPAVCLVPY